MEARTVTASIPRLVVSSMCLCLGAIAIPILVDVAPEGYGPSAAVGPSGGIVATWTVFDPDNDYSGSVHARRFDSDGVALGDPFPVSSTSDTGANDRDSRISMDAEGNFTIVWNRESASDGDNIFARRFAANGTPLGEGEIQVNDLPEGCFGAGVAVDSLGNAVVVWEDGITGTVQAQRFAPDGTRIGANYPAAAEGQYVDIGASPDGAIGITGNVWHQMPTVNLAWFGSDGTSLGDTVVATYDPSDNLDYPPYASPPVALDSSGNTIVGWQRVRLDAETGLFSDIYVSRYDAAGTPVGDGPVLVRSVRINNPFVMPSYDLDVAADGSVLIVWTSATEGNLFAQRLTPAGTLDGDRFIVPETAGEPFSPRVDFNANGDAVIVWSGPQNQVQAKIYPTTPAPGTATGTAFTDTNGNGVQDEGEPAQAGRRVYADIDNNGQYDPDYEPSAITAADGSYELTGLPPGTTTIRQVDLPGWRQTSPIVQGVEFQVHTTRERSQLEPSVSHGPDGGFVVVWTTDLGEGDGPDIAGQRFAPDGTRIGQEFVVNSHRTEPQREPSISHAPDGSFVVTWSTDLDAGDGGDIAGQWFAPDGTRIGEEFQVNTSQGEAQSRPAIAHDGDGDFVVVWQSAGQDGDGGGIFGQRFANDGTKAGAEFQVNTWATGDQAQPSVSQDQNGDFVVAWQSAGQDGEGWGIFGQRYGPNGTKAGDEFQINALSTGDQSQPGVKLDRDGDFVVVWQSAGQDGDGGGVFGQRFARDGTKTGDEFRVNTWATGDQTQSNVALDQDGDFVVVWESAGQDGDGGGVFGQRFAPTGAPVGPEFQVNTTTTGTQTEPRVSMTPDGFVVVWTSETQDPDGSSGIFAQRFTERGDGTYTVEVTSGDTVAGLDFASQAAYDYGDAPDPTYPTLAANDGPRHRLSTNLRLGSLVSADWDGQPDVNAAGDDGDDGIALAPVTVGHTGTIGIDVQGAPDGAKLDAWIDFDGDGTFDASGERITDAGGTTVVNGANTLTVEVPLDAEPGDTIARFRLSLDGNLLPAGTAQDGEVEDHPLTINADLAGPRVTATNIPEGGVLFSGPLSFRAQFDESLDPRSLDTSDVTLHGDATGNHPPTSVTIDPATGDLIVQWDDVPDDTLQLTLVSGDGAFEDLSGNDLDGAPSDPLPSGDGIPGGDFVRSFSVDHAGPRALVPFSAIPPLGGFISQSLGNLGAIHPRDTGDEFVIPVTLDTALTVLSTPSAALQLQGTVWDPQGTMLATGTAQSAGARLMLPSLPAADPGTYTIHLGAAGGTAGIYSMQLLLNASIEGESIGGGDNDSLSGAQNLDRTFVQLGSGPGTRAAVRGETGDGDWYSFSLASREHATMVLAPTEAGAASIELFDGNGSLLAEGMPTQQGYQAIDGFVPSQSGMYFARVQGTDSLQPYTLLVTRNAGFDIEPNDDANTSQPLFPGDPDVVHGYLTHGPDSSDVDLYRFSATPGTEVWIDIDRTSNDLDPVLELLDAGGTVVASSTTGELRHTPGTRGGYTVRVRPAPESNAGAYILRVGGVADTPVTFGAETITPADGTNLPAFPRTVTLAFSGPILLSTVDASDVRIGGLPAIAVEIVDGKTLRFMPDAEANTGVFGYAIELAAGALTSLRGVPSQPSATEFTVGNRPDIDITKVADPTSALPGQVVTFTVTVHNSGNATATNTIVSESLGTNLSFISANPQPGQYQHTPAGQADLWTIPSLAPDANAILTLRAQLDPPAQGEGWVENRVSATCTETGDNKFEPEQPTSVEILQPETTDVGVAKTVSPETARPGDTVTYTVTVTNHGQAEAVLVQVTDQFPIDHSTPGIADPSQGTYDASTPDNHIWHVGNIATGANASVSITGTLKAGLAPGTSIDNLAEVSTPYQADSENGNDTSHATVTVLATMTPSEEIASSGRSPSVAAAGSGRALLAWVAPAGSPTPGVFAQLLDETGAKNGDSFQVYAPTRQGEPDRCLALSDHEGNWVVVWSEGVPPQTVFGQRLDADGSLQGDPFPINSADMPVTVLESAAMNRLGIFAVGWTGDDPDTGHATVFVRRFAADGTALDTDLALQGISGDPSAPQVAMDLSGSMTITWQEESPESSTIMARRFRPDGTPLPPVTVDSVPVDGVSYVGSPDVATDSAGRYVVVWTREEPTRAGPVTNIILRRFDLNGTPSTDPLQVGMVGTGEDFAQVAMAPSGSFVVTWTDHRSRLGEFCSREYDPSCVPWGGTIRLSDAVPPAPFQLGTAVSATGRAFAVWTEDETEVFLSHGPLLPPEGETVLFGRILDAGWTLFSLPVEPLNPALDAVFPAQRQASPNSVRGWSAEDGQYVSPEAIHAFSGYWVFSCDPDIIIVPGVLPAAAPLPLQTGWNLVGPWREGNPTSTVGSQAWGWHHPRYHAAYRLYLGSGYWVLSPQEQDMDLE